MALWAVPPCFGEELQWLAVLGVILLGLLGCQIAQPKKMMLTSPCHIVLVLGNSTQ
jgi:hypothetical protein